MPSNRAFRRLPLRFDAARLEQELERFHARDWWPQDGAADGQAAICLVSVGGTSNADFALSGPVQATRHLARSPYLQEVLRAFGMPVSRCRLLKLPGRTATPMRGESNYHWFRRRPAYVPIVTDEAVRFFCRGAVIPMAAGQAWQLDPAEPHWISNETERDCFHLLVETRETPPCPAIPRDADQARLLSEAPEPPCQVPLEPYCFEVLSPREIGALTATILAALEAAAKSGQAPGGGLSRSIEEFREQWAGVFARYGHQPAGELAYQDLVAHFQERIAAPAARWIAPATPAMKAVEVIRSMLWRSSPAPRRLDRQLLARKRRDARPTPEPFQGPVFDRPLFIVSAPRAGSTLLFETLARLPGLWTMGEEGHETIEGIPELHPAARQYDSNRLTASDAPPHLAASLRLRFARQLQDREGRAWSDLPLQQRPRQLRFLEKTPKNALRIPFLRAVFPDALFIHLYRDPAENIGSLLEGWRSRRYVAYRDLPGWPFREWSFLLVPGWSGLHDRPLAEIAARQWKLANACILDDLQTLPASSRCLVRYTDLVRDPVAVIRGIGRFADLGPDALVEQAVTGSLPPSHSTLSAPSPGKWRKNVREIAAVLPGTESVVDRVEQWIPRDNGAAS